MKEMKKTFLVYVVAILVGAVSISSICSCSKEEPIINNGGGGTKPSDKTEEEQEDVKPVVKIDTIDIVDYKVNPQNILTGEEASLVVNLTHPTYFVVVKEKSGMYDVSKIKYSNDKKQLTIDLPFYTYGTDYHFILTLCDSMNLHKWERKIVVNSFKERYDYEGRVKSAISDNDRETIWMATEFPNRLYRISMSDPQNPTYRDFPNCPNVLTINPYNGKLYVGFQVEDDEIRKYKKRMYVCDPITLAKEDSFLISFYDDYGHLDATPMSIAFTDDGWGVAVRSHYGSGGTDLCYVDSKNGHKTEVDNCWTMYYGSATTSYDKKSVILQKLGYIDHDLIFVNRNNDAAIKKFAVDGDFHSTEYWAGGNRMASRFHRSQPQYLVQCVQSLCLIDYSKGTYSPVYIQEGREPCIEFDYNNANHVIKFDLMDNYVINVDMSDLKEQFVGCLSKAGFKQIYHNTKRDQLIAVSDASSGSCTSQITIFDMDTFR